MNTVEIPDRIMPARDLFCLVCLSDKKIQPVAGFFRYAVPTAAAE